MKPSVVLISSSSSDDEGNSDEEEEEEEVEEIESEDDSDYSESNDRDYDDVAEENDVESDQEDDHNNCYRVDRLHKGSNDLLDPSLNECKEYLRKHGLRLSGTKEECIQRIKEHGRLKDGRGESLYPRSSFSINCTGDACKGDVVLFKQKVHKKRENIAGRKRIVAGRIIKESYGASKQQHTFTVEVLWSKPSKNLPSLSTLLVKGRNLYRFGTFRQPWKNEAERSKVLGEKHARGEAARHKRILRKTEIASSNDKGTKRQKLFRGEPSQNKLQTRRDKHKSAKRQGADPVKKNAMAHKKASRFQNMELKRSIQPPFNSNPNRSIYNDHHLQEASSSFFYDAPSLPNLPPSGFPGYGLYNNRQPRPNHFLNQPHGYYHYNYEQPVPRYRLG